MSEKEKLKLLTKNDLRKFVRIAGSEELAIKELMEFSIPDTFYNTDKDFIWHRSQAGQLIKTSGYASRRLQVLYWVVRIFDSNYKSSTKKEFFNFVDSSDRIIWDYYDMNEEQKAYYYKVVLASPTNRKNFFDKLGYVKADDDGSKDLEATFNKWVNEMKTHGLKYMRDQKLSPIDSSKFRLKPVLL